MLLWWEFSLLPKRNTEHIYINGKSRWSMLHRTDDSFGGSPKYKQSIYPDQKGLEILRGLQEEGMKNVENKDDEGSYFTFNRPANITANGKVIGLSPPEVLKSDGTPLREAIIGKGSDITIKLDVYSHRVPGRPGDKAKAARLSAVRVNNLVPFEMGKDYTEEQKRQIGSLIDQPEPEYNF